jgi:branched-chain amino acid transport system permease protein
MMSGRFIAACAVGLIALVAGGVIPDLIGPYLMRLVIFSLIYALLALSLNLTLGFRGELSLGHQTFFGVGAYTAAILGTSFGLPLLLLLPVTVLAAVVIAVGIGPIALRMRGPYFAIVTLSFGVIAQILALNLVDLTNGPMGISGVGAAPDSLLGWAVSWSRELIFYEILVVLVSLAGFITFALRESRFGRAWRALRDHEDLAAAIGIPAFRLDLLAFVISAGIAGAAGGVYAFYTSVVAPDDVFSFSIVIAMLVAVVLGGRGTILGPIIGAFIFSFAPEYLRIAQDWRLPIFGAVLVLLVMIAPEGLVVLAGRWLMRLGAFLRRDPDDDPGLARHEK